MVVQSKWFCKLIKVGGIALFPFAFVNDKTNKRLVNHELIHIAQAKDEYIIGFYTRYIYFHYKYGYRDNPYEVEAYDNDHNLDYLKTRKKLRFKKSNKA